MQLPLLEGQVCQKKNDDFPQFEIRVPHSIILRKVRSLTFDIVKENLHLKKYHSGFLANQQQSSLLFNEISRDICSDIIYIVGVCGNSGFLLRRAGCSYTNPFLETKHQSKKLFDPFKHHLISLLITWSYCGTVKSRSFMPPHTVDHVYSASKDKISRHEKIIWYY